MAMYCTDFEGIEHCSSCHYEWNDGYSPSEVYKSDVFQVYIPSAEDKLLAFTCCIAYDVVLEKLREVAA